MVSFMHNIFNHLTTTCLCETNVTHGFSLSSGSNGMNVLIKKDSE